MIFQSYNDGLTELYNRNFYEITISELEGKPMNENLAYISMDLNGLKNANDNYGHEAGDELLKGAAVCMKKVFSPYGKIFRIGGDEFCAIVSANRKQLEVLKADFENAIQNWKGNLIKSNSISCGYASKYELENPTITEIAELADRRMYAVKSSYYQNAGIDRRGQNEAYMVLYSLYIRILKINITDDTFKVINSKTDENEDFMNQTKISEWLKKFIDMKQIHPDDSEMFSSKTELSFLRNYFLQDKKIFTLTYRRKCGDKFRKAIMDIIPASDYTNEKQMLFLYVKYIE